MLSEREWLAAGRFSVADRLMVDVLRVLDVRNHGHWPSSIFMAATAELS